MDGAKENIQAVEDILAHYGVKGMRWGIRKEEETSDQKAASFKPGLGRTYLIEYHTAQVKAQQKRIDYVKAHPSKWSYVQRQNEKEIKQREKIRDQHVKDIEKLKQGKLTDFQKKALIGAGITAAVLITVGAYKLHDERARRYIQEGDKIISPIKFKRNDALARTMTSDQIMHEVVPQINPGHGYGRKINCLRCTFAYELRRRGFDVEATSTSKGGPEQVSYEVAKALSGAFRKKVTDSPLGEHVILPNLSSVGKVKSPEDQVKYGRAVASSIFESLSKHDPGARGDLSMSWLLGGAHSIAWEKVGSSVHIFDTQNGKHFKTAEEFIEYAKNISEVAYTRLDDVDLDEAFLTGWIQNVKS
jgi:hypothetical protein